MVFKRHECPVEVAVKVVGGRWKLIILNRLSGGTQRYGALKSTIPGISEKMLIQQLRQLEHDGLVHREQYPEVPPRVEYSLTVVGTSLVPVLDALSDWSQAHLMSGTEKASEQNNTQMQLD